LSPLYCRQLEEDHAQDVGRLREEHLKALQEQQDQADAQVGAYKIQYNLLSLQSKTSAENSNIFQPSLCSSMY
jgi:hypothetical protein